MCCLFRGTDLGSTAEEIRLVRFLHPFNSYLSVAPAAVPHLTRMIGFPTHRGSYTHAVRCAVWLAAWSWVGVMPVVGSTHWKADIGYTELVNSLAILGTPVPDGKGVPVALVESTQNLPSQGIRNYKPDPAYFDFDAATDPYSQTVEFIDASFNNCTGGACTSYSTHARAQAFTILGNSQSVAPGANQLTLYEANHYLQSVLKAPNGGTPATQNFRVQNFSWIGTYDDPTQDRSALRRFDFLIDRDNVTAVVGVNNGSTTTLPNLMAHAYNAISVGRTDGNHSSGLTTLESYGPGRSKPDIVAPQLTSSQATSMVSSAATMLHSAVAGTNAAKSEVIKAILMAGATKSEFESWSRTPTQPLDAVYGAGELNVFNSYLMTLGGRYAGSSSAATVVGTHGWDYSAATPGADNALKYKFVVPAGKSAPDLSILLTWNVDVNGSFTSQTLADMNLLLTNSLGQVVDRSISSVNNVEHIYLENLTAGEYTLSVSTDTTTDFGLAWRMSTLSEIATADFNGDGTVDGRDFLAWQRGYGKLLGATLADGDADGDGKVDSADLAIYQSQYQRGSLVAPPLMLATVPEPGSALLVAGGLLAFLLKRRR